MPDITHERAQVFTANPVGTGMVLLNGGTVIGTGNGFDVKNFGSSGVCGWWIFQASGNSASAQFLVSMDSATWYGLSSVVTGINQTMTGLWSGFYPYIAAQVTWISNSGGNTASAYLKLALK